MVLAMSSHVRVGTRPFGQSHVASHGDKLGWIHSIMNDFDSDGSGGRQPKPQSKL